MANSISHDSNNVINPFNIGYLDVFPLLGLKTIGKNSYINSILQSFLHIPELSYYFINNYPIDCDKLNRINYDGETNGILSKEYYQICEHFYNYSKKYNFKNFKDNFYIPRSFINNLSRLNQQFSLQNSGDAKVLLLYLIQNMHKELNYNGHRNLSNKPISNYLIEKESYFSFIDTYSMLNKSIFSDLFFGIIKTCQKCLNCHTNYFYFDAYQYLVFPLYNFKNKNFNLYKGFKEYIRDKLINLYCKTCAKYCRGVENSTVFYSSLYLIIIFYYGKEKKDYPRNIDFGAHISLEGFVDNSNQEIHDLVSVISFINNDNNYISYYIDKENKWHLFNDTVHKECKFEEIFCYSPYILIYRKNNNNE